MNDNNENRARELAAKNRRLAISLAVVALLIYIGYILVYY